jgi:hypothetical protein
MNVAMHECGNAAMRECVGIRAIDEHPHEAHHAQGGRQRSPEAVAKDRGGHGAPAHGLRGDERARALRSRRSCASDGSTVGGAAPGRVVSTALSVGTFSELS